MDGYFWHNRIQIQGQSQKQDVFFSTFTSLLEIR